MDNVSAVKEKIDIIDLISGYVPLKRAGKNYKASCPFHSEKTPSFMVSPELQRYRCFGCGKSGDIFNFVMDIEGVDFAEALKVLADRAGVKLQFDKSGYSVREKSQKEKIIRMNDLAASFYHHVLLRHKYGRQAREYLKKRGIKPATIKKFKIGYAPKSWNSLSDLLNAKGLTSEDIVKGGLGKYRNNNQGIYDIFRGRLMFPAMDHMGRVVGFSGRALFENQDPKYINTPETPVFHKESFLYGLFQSKTTIRQKNSAIIVEGQFDMISPFQNGVKNVVASGGTAITLKQMNLLKRYTDTAVLVFDSDEAGVKAVIRGVQVMQGFEMNIKVAPIPKKFKDPDEMVQKDKKGFIELIKNAVPLWDFYFMYVSSNYDLSDIYERKSASAFLAKRISQIQDKVVRNEYIKKFQTLFDLSGEVAVEVIEKANNEPTAIFSNSIGSKELADSDSIFGEYPPAEVYLLVLLMRADLSKIKSYTDSIEEMYFSSDTTKKVFNSVKKSVRTNKKLEIRRLYDKLRESDSKSHSLLENVYLFDLEGQLSDPDLLESEIASAVNRLKKDFLTRKIKESAAAVRKAEAVSDRKLVAKLQADIKKYSLELVKLSS